MTDPFLNLLKLLLLALVYLFFLRVLWAVWAEMRDPKPSKKPKPRAGGAAAPGGSLRIIDPPDKKGKTFALGNELTVGRAAGCQISLDDTFASQLHARIFRKEGKLYLEDLGSTNGTFLNRKKVTAPAPLRTGDRIQVGRTVLEVRR